MDRERIDKYPSKLTPGVDLIANPADHIVFRTAEGTAEVAKQLGKRIFGQLSMEHDDFPSGVQLMLCCYPDGDLYVWFMENLHFVLVAKVDGRAKTLALIPVDHANEFMGHVNAVANKMNLKHNYPVEYPDDFTPTAAEGENTPDAENH